MKGLALYNLDPRCKLMMMGCISTAAMLTSNLYVEASFVLLTALTLALGQVRMVTVLHNVKGLALLILSLFAVQCLCYGKDGFFLACLLSLRLFIIVLAAQILLQGEPRDYLLALVQCRMPYEIAFTVMAGIHFMPILREEAFNVFYSVQLRGTELKRISIPKKFRLYGKICLPILINSINRSKDMSMAMEARGLRAYQSRTYMRKLTLRKRDVWVLVLYPVVVFAIFFVINIL